VFLNLYHTLGCHLCELAENVVSSHNLVHDLPLQIQIKKIDIASDDILVSQFGIRIPVLENPVSKQTLDWPFNQEDLSLFIQQNQ
jgi:hypothetical protein